jgi:hypothetical protein
MAGLLCSTCGSEEHDARGHDGSDVRAVFSKLDDESRARWSVRVLDAWADAQGKLVTPHPFRPMQDSALFAVHGVPGVRGPTRDAARLAAAEAVFDALPANARTTLGERP